MECLRPLGPLASLRSLRLRDDSKSGRLSNPLCARLERVHGALWQREYARGLRETAPQVAELDGMRLTSVNGQPSDWDRWLLVQQHLKGTLLQLHSLTRGHFTSFIRLVIHYCLILYRSADLFTYF